MSARRKARPRRSDDIDFRTLQAEGAAARRAGKPCTPPYDMDGSTINRRRAWSWKDGWAEADRLLRRDWIADVDAPHLTELERQKRLQFWHAQGAARKRHGIRLTWDLHDALVRQVQAKQSTVLAHSAGGNTVHLVTYNEARIRVVYDPRTRQIVTFLPLEDDPEWLRAKRQELVDAASRE